MINYFILSCNENMNGTFKIENFDIYNLELKSESNLKNKWYCNSIYTNDTLINLLFFDKKNNKLIKVDSVIYRDKLRYFVNISDIKFDSIKLKLVKVTFLKNHKMQRHFLIKYKGKFYLICIDKENDKSIFIRQRINTNLYRLESKTIEEYLDNIDTFGKKKYYFSDFRTYKMLYKNEILIIEQSHYFNWGVGNEFPKEFSKNYCNLYLDLDKNDEMVYLMDSSAIDKD